MKNKWRVMLSVIAAVFLLSLLVVPVLGATTATRTIGDTTLTVGQSTTVTVSITTTDEWCLVLTEAVPAGLAMSAVTPSAGGTYNAGTGEILWLDIGQNPLGTVTVSYTLTATAGGNYTIAGTVVDDGANVVATVDSSVAVSGGVAGTTATRTIGDTSLTVGQSTAVTVSITTTDEWCLILTEAVPAGLAMSAVTPSAGGTYNAGTGEILWLDIGQNPLGTVTVSYTLTGTALGSYTITGTVIDDEENVVATVNSSVAVNGEAPPGEYPSFTAWLDWWI